MNKQQKAEAKRICNEILELHNKLKQINKNANKSKDKNGGEADE